MMAMVSFEKSLHLLGIFPIFAAENPSFWTNPTKPTAMTTVELRTSIATDLEQMSLEMLEKVSRYVKDLRLHPRTVHVEELLERAEKGRREIAEGNYVTSEEVFRDLFEEFGLDPNDMKEIEKQVEEAEPLYAHTV